MTTIESVVAGACPEPALVPVPRRLNLLAIGLNAEDHEALGRAVPDLEWQISSVRTCSAALQRLRRGEFAAVVCESVLEDGSWKDILETIGAGLSNLIVTSHLADAELWSEVLNLGGYDVIAEPFAACDVVHVLTTISLERAAKSDRTRAAGAR